MVYFLVELKEFSYILNRNLLSDIHFANIFSWSVAFLFLVLAVSFEEQKILIFMKSNLQLIFFFLIYIFCVLRNLCLNQSHKDFVLCFLLEVIILLIYFEVIFIYDMRYIYFCIWIDHTSLLCFTLPVEVGHTSPACCRVWELGTSRHWESLSCIVWEKLSSCP